MVLTYLQIPIPYARLRRILGTTEEGTPFHHLDRLRRWGLTVVQGQGNMDLLATYLRDGLPVIVDVQTGDIPYCQARTDINASQKDTAHAVVVVGFEWETLYVNDPDFEDAPQVMTLGDFHLAWEQRENRYAVIGLADVT
jgi:hypothetical protein